MRAPLNSRGWRVRSQQIIQEIKKEQSDMGFDGKTIAEVLANFVYQTNYDDLPEEAIQMSRKMILDQLGAELVCSTLDWNKKVLKYAQDLAVGSDEATIFGYGVRSSAEHAAFVNATFGHGFEVDDFNPAA